LDVNHREIVLTEKAEAGQTYNIDLYTYSGMNEGHSELLTCISVLEKSIEKLYYHIKVPLEIAEQLHQEDKRRSDILNYLTMAVNMIDLRKAYSESFYRTIEEAARYLDDEFYGKFGPTKEMLENAARLDKGIPGSPKVRMGKALDFFQRLDAKVSGNKKLPKWVGELYLEYHRGTYTSIARNKKYNREVLKAKERANVLQAFEDKPHNYDAWDINIYYQ